MGLHKKSYGNFQDRVYLLEMDDNDATLVITNIDLNDYGTYMCEIINGMNDKITEVDLELQGNFIISWCHIGYHFTCIFFHLALIQSDLLKKKLTL